MIGIIKENLKGEKWRRRGKKGKRTKKLMRGKIIKKMERKNQ